MASDILTIAWHEYRTNVRRAGFLIFTFLVPALGLLGWLVVGSFAALPGSALRAPLEASGRPIGVVDHSGLFTPIAAEFAQRFVAFGDDDGARAALLRGEVASYVVISDNYLQTGAVNGYVQGGWTGAASVDPQALTSFLVSGTLAGRVDAATRARAAEPLNATTIVLDGRGQPARGGLASLLAGLLIPYALSILLLLSIFVSSSYLLRSVSEEKETRVIEIVLSSITPAELLAGKVIGLSALGLTQIGVWLAASIVFSGGLGALVAGVAVALSPGTFLLAAMYFLLGYLVYGTLMAAAGALGTNMRESQQMAGIFAFLAAVPWLVNGVLLADPEASIVRVLSVFPLTAPTMMMLRLAAGNVPMLDIVGSITILVLSIPLTVWGGAKVFRLGLLMYGKRPSLAQVWRTLRQV